MIEVYKPSAKALRTNAFKDEYAAEFRLIFRYDGSALLYFRDEVIDSSLKYRKPDSHCELAAENMPETLKIDHYELDHVNTHQIDMFGIELVVVDELEYNKI